MIGDCITVNQLVVGSNPTFGAINVAMTGPVAAPLVFL